MAPELIEVLVNREHRDTITVTTTTTTTTTIAASQAQAEDADGSVPEPEQSPPPQYPVSEASSSPRPPPFSSLFAPLADPGERSGKFVAVVTSVETECRASGSLAAPAYTSASESVNPDQSAARAFRDPVTDTKRALPRDTKGESSRKDDDTEPPPAYSEGDSPLQAFAYLMAAAGGASSIITQVQQGGPPINAIGGKLCFRLIARHYMESN